MDLVFALVSDLHFANEARYDGKLRKLTARFVEKMNGVVHPELVFNWGDDIEDESREKDLERYDHGHALTLSNEALSCRGKSRSHQPCRRRSSPILGTPRPSV
ncbi:MAG TPA: hypothetical protein VF881_04080 [Polyangiaceae bacterium]